MQALSRAGSALRGTHAGHRAKVTLGVNQVYGWAGVCLTVFYDFLITMGAMDEGGYI